MTSSRLESFEDLLREAARFRDERDWAQFHTPKNLAAAIAVEAAELQEIFLWHSSGSVPLDSELQLRVEQELADVRIHCANFALALDIDLPDALAAKFAANEERYPVAKARGNATKYTDL